MSAKTNDKADDGSFCATDAKGRVFTVRKPDFLAQFRLVEVLGQSAQNDMYMRMVGPLTFIGAIDGDQIPLPTSKAQLEALIKRVGEEGYVAVVECVAEKFGVQGSHEEAVKNA
jgi:hypothetical protein